jgi:hypothetical protein
MIGARCALIAEAVVSMEFKASAEHIKNVTSLLQKSKKLQLQIIEQYTYSFYDLH